MDAGTSWRPLFLHRRMWPKWLATGLLALAAASWVAPSDVTWALAGAGAFTIGEYLLHRFLLHGPLHGLHDRHHATPQRLDVLFLPASTVAALPLLFAVGWPLAGPGPTTAALLGLMAALLLYELVHFIAHGPAPASDGRRLAAWWRVHHLRHHGQGGRYAVLLPSLDRLFRSVTEAEKWRGPTPQPTAGSELEGRRDTWHTPFRSPNIRQRPIRHQGRMK